MHGLYIPYWTFDAQVAARWTAEAGHYYYVTERRGNKTEQVRKVRWEPAAGALDHFFDDELVPATQGVPADLLGKVEPFATQSLVPYDAGYVSGWVVEQYQIDLVAAAQSARTRMDGTIRQLCSAQVPGDTQRNLQVDADYSQQTFKHVLVPLWIVAYNYGSRTFQVLVNGQTGRIAGKHPYSWVKIALAILAALIVADDHRLPPGLVGPAGNRDPASRNLVGACRVRASTPSSGTALLGSPNNTRGQGAHCRPAPGRPGGACVRGP